MTGGLKSYTFVWHTRPQFKKEDLRWSPKRFSSFLCCRLHWNQGLYLQRVVHNNQPNYYRHNWVFEWLKMSQHKLQLTLLWDFFIFMAILKAVQDWDPQWQLYRLTVHLSFCPTILCTENEPSMVSRGPRRFVFNRFTHLLFVNFPGNVFFHYYFIGTIDVAQEKRDVKKLYQYCSRLLGQV